MNGALGKPKGPRQEPLLGEGSRSLTGAPSPTADLQVALLQMDAAVIAEGIEPSGPLGVWCRAQRSMIVAMIASMEDASARVEGKAQAVEAAMRAEVDLVRVTVEAARQQMATWRAENENLKEERLKAGDDMAIRMSEKIRVCLKTTMLVRERRWNLSQNLRLVGLGVAVLFAAFVGGQWEQGYSEAQAIIERCRTNRTMDPSTKVSYCAMSLVDGIADPIPSLAPAR